MWATRERSFGKSFAPPRREARWLFGCSARRCSRQGGLNANPRLVITPVLVETGHPLSFDSHPAMSLHFMKPPLGLALFFLFAVIRAHADNPSPTPPWSNYQEPPKAHFDYELVRVWNARGEPPEGSGHVPEAKLGDRLIVEVKQIDTWLGANLDAGAWMDDPKVIAADPLLRKMIEAHHVSAAVRMAKWLRMKNAEDLPSTSENPAAADDKN